VTVSGRDDVESDSWARVDVHIVNAQRRNAKKNSGGRGGFRYGFLAGRPWPSMFVGRIVMSYICLSFPCSWLDIDDV
jgi:hypothetical protein